MLGFFSEKDRRCLLADVNLLNYAKNVWIAHISFSLKDTFVGTLWDQESTYIVKMSGVILSIPAVNLRTESLNVIKFKGIQPHCVCSHIQCFSSTIGHITTSLTNRIKYKAISQSINQNLFFFYTMIFKTWEVLYRIYNNYTNFSPKISFLKKLYTKSKN